MSCSRLLARGVSCWSRALAHPLHHWGLGSTVQTFQSGAAGEQAACDLCFWGLKQRLMELASARFQA